VHTHFTPEHYDVTILQIYVIYISLFVTARTTLSVELCDASQRVSTSNPTFLEPPNTAMGDVRVLLCAVCMSN